MQWLKKSDGIKESRKDALKDLSFIAAIFLVVAVSHLPLAKTELMSPDASGYLDMGKNLFSGKGAVISFNLYQYWPGKYYPSLPYMQPLYSVLAGLVWALFGLKAVIGLNIILLAVNCAVFYMVIRFNADPLTSLLLALFIGFSKNFVFTAIFPWTEQLHLLFLLTAIFIYLKWERSAVAIGMLFGLSYLVRVAGSYNIVAFGMALVALKGFSKAAVKEYIKMTTGFLLIFVPYELFCYLKYKAFYAEYLTAARIYRAAEVFPGAFYKKGVPVLNMPAFKIDAKTLSLNAYVHFMDYVAAFRHIKFALVLVPVYVIYDLLKRKGALYVIFFFQGAGVMFFYIASLAWLPEIESVRYSLIPIMMLGSAGFLYAREILGTFFPEKLKKSFPALFLIVLACFVFVEIRDYLPFRSYYMNSYRKEYGGYRQARDEMYAWIKANTGRDDLIASHLLADPCLFERPVVSLPSGKAVNDKNVKDFLGIYAPAYVLTMEANKGFIDFLMNIGFTDAKRCGGLVLLKGIK